MRKLPFSKNLYVGLCPEQERLRLYRQEKYTERIHVDLLRCTKCDVDVTKRMTLESLASTVVDISAVHACIDGVYLYESCRTVEGRRNPRAVRVNYSMGDGDPLPHVQTVGRAAHVTYTGEHPRTRFVPVKP